MIEVVIYLLIGSGYRGLFVFEIVFWKGEREIQRFDAIDYSVPFLVSIATYAVAFNGYRLRGYIFMTAIVSRLHYAKHDFSFRPSNGCESVGANIYGVAGVSWKACTLYRGSLRRSMNKDIHQSTKQTLARKGKAKQAPALGYTEWQSRHAADESERTL